MQAATSSASALPPEVAAIMAQINSLPADIRALTLNALGRQVEVASSETQKELREKTSEAYRLAVQKVYDAIPREMNWSHGCWKVLSKELTDTRTFMANLMCNHLYPFRGVEKQEAEKFEQAAKHYLAQLNAIENDPEAIDYACLSVYDLVTLLATDSSSLIEKGTLGKIAKLAKEKLLGMPAANEESNQSVESFRKHFTYANAVREVVKYAPLESDQEGVELLKRVQPQGYLSELHRGVEGISRIDDVFKTKQMTFAQMVGEALQAAPNWSIKIILDDLESKNDWTQQVYLLAKASAHVKDLEYRLRVGLASIKCCFRDVKPQPLFDYYLSSFRAVELLGGNKPQRQLPFAMNHYAREHRVTLYDVRSNKEKIDLLALIGALTWEDLLTLYQSEQEMKGVMKKEILRQLTGEPKGLIFSIAEKMSSDQLALLKELLADQEEVKKKLREASSFDNPLLKKEDLDCLKRALGLGY